MSTDTPRPFDRIRGRRAPLTTGRAQAAARTLSTVLVGEHPVGAGDTPGDTWARRLAARKLGELYDETGGIVVEVPAARYVSDRDLPDVTELRPVKYGVRSHLEPAEARAPGVRIVNTDPDPFRRPWYVPLEESLAAAVDELSEDIEDDHR